MKKKFFKTKDECEVTFEHITDSGQNVALVSESNGWLPVEMKKTHERWCVHNQSTVSERRSVPIQVPDQRADLGK